jgi:hypothetical protein
MLRWQRKKYLQRHRSRLQTRRQEDHHRQL